MPAVICAGDGIACFRRDDRGGNGHDTMIGTGHLPLTRWDMSLGPEPTTSGIVRLDIANPPVRHELTSSTVPLLLALPSNPLVVGSERKASEGIVRVTELFCAML